MRQIDGHENAQSSRELHAGGAPVSCLPKYRQVCLSLRNHELRVGQKAAAAYHPFGLAWVAIVQGIEHEFHAGRDPQLFENPEKIFLDRVVAQVKFAGDLAIGESLGDQRDDLFFAWSQDRATACVHHTQRWNLGDQIEQAVQLLGVDPDLPCGDAQETFAEQAQVGFRNVENAANPGAKCVHHEFAVPAIEQKHFRDVGMGQVEAAQRAYDFGDLCRGRWREQRDSRRVAGNRLQNGIRIHGAGDDVKFGTAAQRAAEQLHLHAVGVGDEQTDALRTVDEGRTHNRGLYGVGVQAAILGSVGGGSQGNRAENSHTNFKMGTGLRSSRA
jgi:hypothetical protein